MSTAKWREENKERLRKYRREWFQRNKEHARKRVSERMRERRDWFQRLKRELMCSSCGEDHPACLDFHHREPDKKDKEICWFVGGGYSRERILEEIKKCDVVCANCHRKLHWPDGGKLRTKKELERYVPVPNGMERARRMKESSRLAKPEKRKQARELRRKGMSYRSIQKELKVSAESVWRWVRDVQV